MISRRVNKGRRALDVQTPFALIAVSGDHLCSASKLTRHPATKHQTTSTH